MWTLLVMAHLFGLTAYTLLLRKKTSSQSNKLFITFLMQIGLFVPSLVYIPMNKITLLHTPTEWFFLCTGAVLLTGYMVFNVLALAKLDASIFTVLFNLRIFVITILGYLLLAELPTFTQVIGGLIIFGSIAYLYVHKTIHWKSRSTLLGLFTMIWFSMHALLERYNLRFWSPEDYLFFIQVIGLVLMLPLLFIRKINIRQEMRHVRDGTTLLLMVTRAISAYGYVYALMFGSLAITSYISSLSVVFIVLSGIYFLGERTHVRKKLLAAAIACVGLTLILYGKLIV